MNLTVDEVPHRLDGSFPNLSAQESSVASSPPPLAAPVVPPAAPASQADPRPPLLSSPTHAVRYDGLNTHIIVIQLHLNHQ
jgi:hypothetical protein